MFWPRAEVWAVAAAMVLAALGWAEAAEPVRVTFAGRDSGAQTYKSPAIQGLLYRPATVGAVASAGPRPAIVALHGCGGNMRANGRDLVARVSDWSERWLAAGYAVIWPDSFGSRGLGPQCGVADRAITPAIRAGDALAAADWLAAQPVIDPSRIALVGWSNGGSTVLRAIAATSDASDPRFKMAIAFYPGCRPLADPTRRVPWSTTVPLTILMGAADDWTPPEPCRVLGTRTNVRMIEYPGAYHDFDAPDLPVRLRKNLAFTAGKSGEAHVGTNPAARAAAIAEVTAILAGAFR